MTASFAPPCAGPQSADMPAAIAEYGFVPELPGEPDGGRAAVLLVIGVQNEQQVEGLGGYPAHRVWHRRDGKEHVEQIAAIVEAILRIHERLAERVLVGSRRDRGKLCDDPMRKRVTVVRISNVGAVVIEGRHRGDYAAIPSPSDARCDESR